MDNHSTNYEPSIECPLVFASGRKCYFGGPKIDGGMTQAEMNSILDRNKRDYEDMITKQEAKLKEMELDRIEQDRATANKEIQSAAADQAMIATAQKRLKDEIEMQDEELSEVEKQDIQSTYDSLFKSFLKGGGA